MHLNRTLPIFLLLFPLFSVAQDYSLFSGARSEGLAHTTVSVRDVFSSFHNPSLLAWNEENWAGLSGRNNFNISTMNSAYGTAAFRTGSGNAGFNFQYNGNSGFYDVRAGGYYAQGFGEVLAASVSLNLYQYRLQGFDASFAFTADLGMTAKIEQLTLGLYWGNLNNGEYSGTFNEEIANYLRFGGAYYFQENFFITLEGVQDLGNEFGFRGGLEYLIEEVVAVRGGYSSLPKSTTMGVSIYIKQFSIDMAGAWHPQLGFSPHVGATYRW